ncbi:hypothetical protein KSC_029620 [Ktedonobacter sp. SOSP1-52]|uniref:hypothetical protein n=1 Tax=Ktedonobacter sp. SOSP1-52 TaxID=2778366 RepID=UPI0019151F85|nr:hypothetical protein [Ktedonobacter sp. SOSP1-52]GHO64070.1 hypothetical protein KSC_029620 [Ktedonobacter sp. SOSP1-52]
MKILPLEASDQEILDAVREWVGLLIEERYTDAYEFLYHEDSLQGWTPEFIATVIQNYGSLDPDLSGEVFTVTSLDQAKVDPPRSMPLRQDVHRYRDADSDSFRWDPEGEDDDVGGDVHFGLPLNGHASDLTAILDFCVVKNHIVFQLRDIRVM